MAGLDRSVTAGPQLDLVEPWSRNFMDRELKKAQHRLKQYQAALRLAGAEIERRNRGIMALTRFIYQANRGSDPTNLLKLALTQALDVTQAPVGAIVLIEPETKELSLTIQKGLTPEFADILSGRELGQGAVALMPHLVSGAGALLEAETADDEMERLLLDAGHLTSLVSLPVQFSSRLIGALLVGLQGKDMFKAVELYLLMSICQQIAISLESLRLREGLWHTFETLLSHETATIDLQEVDQAELQLNIDPPFELPPSAAKRLPSAEDDLEQLISAMMEAEDELQQQNRDLQTLNLISDRINQTLQLEEILQIAVDQTRVLLEGDAAWLYLMNEKNHLELRAHVGLSPTYVRGMKILKRGDGIEGRAAAQNRAYVTQTVTEDSISHKIWVDKEGLRAIAAVPITRPGRQKQAGAGNSQVIGVLAIGRRVEKAHSWSPREMRLLSSIANQVAPTIENAQLYARTREDQTGLKIGNDILRSVNDMLLEKNAFLDGFIQDDLKPALVKACELLENLHDDDAPSFSRTYKKDIAVLQQVIEQLSNLVQEASMISSALDSEFDQALDRKEPEHDYAGSTKPIRFEKRHAPKEVPEQGQIAMPPTDDLVGNQDDARTNVSR